MPEGHVYILGNTTRTLYTGVTNKFDRRLLEHKTGINSEFASKHRCNRLLLHERYIDIRSAIAREKEINGGPEQRNSPSSPRQTHNSKTSPRNTAG